MAQPPPTVVLRSERRDEELLVELVDLAGPLDEVLARAVIGLPAGHGGVVRALQVAPDLVDRLLVACADELRAIGRRRLVLAPEATTVVDRGALVALGFACLSRGEGPMAVLAL